MVICCLNAEMAILSPDGVFPVTEQAPGGQDRVCVTAASSAPSIGSGFRDQNRNLQPRRLACSSDVRGAGVDFPQPSEPQHCWGHLFCSSCNSNSLNGPMFHCYLSGRPWVSRGAERAASVLSMSLTLMQLAPCSSLEPIRRRGSETVRERRAVPPGELTGLSLFCRWPPWASSACSLCFTSEVSTP